MGKDALRLMLCKRMCVFVQMYTVGAYVREIKRSVEAVSDS